MFIDEQEPEFVVAIYLLNRGAVNIDINIGIPKIVNVGASMGSDGINISAFLGVEDVIESHVNINFNSSSIMELDAKLEAGWDGSMVGAWSWL